MEISDKDKIYLQKQSVHKVLAHSHSAQFVLFLFAVFLDLRFGIKIFWNSGFVIFGVILLIFGSFFIFWAQYTSHHLDKKNITKESFARGPYRYIRNPTNFGIFFMMLGFGITVNSFFVILFSFISSLVVKFIFLEKEEKILSAKYGAPYLEYKKSVKF